MIAVIDGDTVHMGAERYRLLGIDAAEIRHAQCDAERRLGVLTKKRLEALLGTGAVKLGLQNPKRDKYGRLLVHLFVNGEDASCVLIREGYARPWAGRRIKTAPLKTTEGIDCAITAPRP